MVIKSIALSLFSRLTCVDGVQSSRLFSSRTKWGPAQIAGSTQLARHGQLHCNLPIRLFYADPVICMSLIVAHSCEELFWKNYDFFGDRRPFNIIEFQTSQSDRVEESLSRNLMTSS